MPYSLEETKFTKEAPAYLRNYPKFWNLIKLFSNYVQDASNVLANILSNLNLRDASGDILNQIAKRYGIDVEKPIDENGNVEIEKYNSILKFAILGNGIQRSSGGDRSTFNNLLKLLGNIKSMEIRDYRNDPSTPTEKPMVVSADFIGIDPNIDADIIHNYLVPDVTGVNLVVSYLPFNGTLFGYDLDHQHPPETDFYQIAGWDEGEWATTK